jgi:hypothetical protein
MSAVQGVAGMFSMSLMRDGNTVSVLLVWSEQIVR